MLVQQLLIAKRDLQLPKLFQQQASFKGLIIDDVRLTKETGPIVFGTAVVAV